MIGPPNLPQSWHAATHAYLFTFALFFLFHEYLADDDALTPPLLLNLAVLWSSFAAALPVTITTAAYLYWRTRRVANR